MCLIIVFHAPSAFFYAKALRAQIKTDLRQLRNGVSSSKDESSSQLHSAYHQLLAKAALILGMTVAYLIVLIKSVPYF